MLREKAIRRTYPNKTVLEDLLTREGEATEDSWSPYTGKRDVIAEQWGGQWRQKWNLNKFLEMHMNRDVDPAKIGRAGNASGTDSNRPCETLEDTMSGGLEPQSVLVYVRSLFVGCKIDTNSPFRLDTQTTRMVNSFDEDGDSSVSEADLEIRQDDDEISNKLYDETIREMPYIIKYLWCLSKSMKVNLFSFIFAYARCIEYNEFYTVTSRDFLKYPTYKITPTGEPDGQFDHKNANKYVGGPYRNTVAMFQYRDAHPLEFHYIDKFIKGLKVLGLDFKNENCLDYNNEWINSLVCTYLPSNDFYIAENIETDIEVMTAISPNNILSATKTDLYSSSLDSIMSGESSETDVENELYLLGDSVLLSYKAGFLPKNFLDTMHEGFWDFLHTCLAIDAGCEIDIPKERVSFDRIGITRFDGNPVLFPGSMFGELAGADYNVVILKSGYILPVGGGLEELVYMPLMQAYDRLEEVADGISEEGYSSDWCTARDKVEYSDGDYFG